MTHKMKKYSEAFKRQVVSEYEAGSSIYFLRKKYGITGGTTITEWIKRYGKLGFRHELVRIQTTEEANRMYELEQQVKQLEQALGKVVLEKLKLESILEELEEVYGDAVKKNAAASSSEWPTKPGQKQVGQ